MASAEVGAEELVVSSRVVVSSKLGARVPEGTRRSWRGSVAD